MISVFSFGSLIIPESASAAVGRKVTHDELDNAIILGMERYWGVHVPIRMDEAEGEEVDGLFYDLRSAPAHYTNGVLLHVTEEEFDSIEKREAQYEARDVTDHIVTRADVTKVVTFMGAAPYTEARGGMRAIIPQRYEDRILNAARSRGQGFYDSFLATTHPSRIPRIGGTYQFVDPEQAKRV